MKICAIIAEYNPLHKGHIYHIKKVKEITDAIVIVLSGHTTQRGEFSMFNKWTKAKSALFAGANLVLEIPTIFSSSSAQRFANAAIKIIKEMNCVEFLSFGSEIGDIEKIKELAKICKDIDKKTEIKNHLKQGLSYPKARELSIGKKANILKFPNNILGVEYVKSALNLNCHLSFHTIKRIGANHNNLKPEKTASSLYIRNNILDIEKIKKYIPNKILKLYNDPIIIPDKFLFNSLREKTKEDFIKLFDTTEGLYNRLFKFSKQSTSLNEFLKLCKTKRYTLTRLKRIVINSFLDINKNIAPKLPQYSFILGFDSIGKKILNQIKKNENFLFTTNFKKIYKNFPYSATIDSKATNFLLLFEKIPKPCGVNFAQKPIILE